MRKTVSPGFEKRKNSTSQKLWGREVFNSKFLWWNEVNPLFWGWDRALFLSLFDAIHMRLDSWGDFILSPQKVRQWSWHRSNVWFLRDFCCLQFCDQWVKCHQSANGGATIFFLRVLGFTRWHWFNNTIHKLFTARGVCLCREGVGETDNISYTDRDQHNVL